MKRNLFLALGAAALMFAGCSKEPAPTPDPNTDPTPEPKPQEEKVEISVATNTFKADGGTFELTVTSSADWKVTPADGGWIKPSVTSGKSGAKVTFTAQKNADTKERTAYFTFKVGKKTAKFTAKQEAAKPQVASYNSWIGNWLYSGAGMQEPMPISVAANENGKTYKVTLFTDLKPFDAKYNASTGGLVFMKTAGTNQISTQYGTCDTFFSGHFIYSDGKEYLDDDMNSGLELCEFTLNAQGVPECKEGKINGYNSKFTSAAYFGSILDGQHKGGFINFTPFRFPATLQKQEGAALAPMAMSLSLVK